MENVEIWPLICAVLFLTSAVYSFFLQFTDLGRWLCLRRTWLTVVIGTGYVQLVLAAIIPFHLWVITWFAFASAGIPLVARSFYNENQEEKRLERYLGSEDET